VNLIRVTLLTLSIYFLILNIRLTEKEALFVALLGVDHTTLQAATSILPFALHSYSDVRIEKIRRNQRKEKEESWQ
jgi:hypothetical protein